MLLGRRAEQLMITELIDGARAGSGGALVVRGEAGIGKTALLHFARSRAGGMAVLAGTGVESEAELAFAGISVVLRPVLHHVPDLPEPQRVALEAALALRKAVPEDRFAILAGTLSVLARAAEDRPLVVLVDDAHWLDRSSSEALLFAARRVAADPIAMVFAVRTGEPQDLAARDLPQLVLQGLDVGAARELLRGSGPDLPVAVAERIVAATAGNPLALVELRDATGDDAAGWVWATGVPPDVGSQIQAVYRRRLEQLPPETQRALVVASASASGGMAELRAAFSVLSIAPSALDRAETARLVSLDAGILRFSHPLLRAAVYHGARPDQRRAAHRALAQTCTAPQAIAERTWHRLAAAEGPDEALAVELEQTADDARRRGAPSAAAHALRAAASVTAPGERRAQRLLGAGADLYSAGMAEAAASVLAEALGDAEDDATRASVQHLRARTEVFRGTTTGARRLLLDEADRIELRLPEQAAMLLLEAAGASTVAGEPKAVLSAAERAYALVDGTGSPVEPLAAAMLAGAQILRGRARQAVPALRAISEGLPDDPAIPAWFPCLLAEYLTWIGDHRQARDMAARVVRRIRARSALSDLPYATSVLSGAEHRRGRWPAAYAAAAEAVRIADETDRPIDLAASLMALARVEATRGSSEDALAHARRSLNIAAARGADSLRLAGASVTGLVHLTLGRPDEAVGELEAGAALARERGLEEPGVVQYQADLVEACIRAGRLDGAYDHLETLERQARTTERDWAHAAAARCRGLLVGDDDIDATFAGALRWHERVESPFEQARTALCYGERLRRARRRVDARVPLRSALATFDLLGAEPWSARALTELSATGERARSRRDPVVRRLTPQELQVALAVAEGATNREVAAALFLSVKTVETHLGSVFRKVGVRSRVELARRVEDLERLTTSGTDER